MTSGDVALLIVMIPIVGLALFFFAVLIKVILDN
jgi:hypothetical protein